MSAPIEFRIAGLAIAPYKPLDTRLSASEVDIYAPDEWCIAGELVRVKTYLAGWRDQFRAKIAEAVQCGPGANTRALHEGLADQCGGFRVLREAFDLQPGDVSGNASRSPAPRPIPPGRSRRWAGRTTSRRSRHGGIRAASVA